VRLGDVRLKVLAGVDATVIVGPEELDLVADIPTPPPVGGPPPARSVSVTVPTSERATIPGPAGPAAARSTLTRRRSRPLMVTVLVMLWLATALAAPAAALLLAARGDLGGAGSAAVVAAALLAGAASGVMAFGLRALAPWARHLQIAVAALGLFACPFSLASATVLLYLLRPEVKQGFEERSPNRRPAGAGSAEVTFAVSLLGMIALGLLVTAFLARYLGIAG
jgi:hypothetical protein